MVDLSHFLLLFSFVCFFCVAAYVVSSAVSLLFVVESVTSMFAAFLFILICLWFFLFVFLFCLYFVGFYNSYVQCPYIIQLSCGAASFQMTGPVLQKDLYCIIAVDTMLLWHIGSLKMSP